MFGYHAKLLVAHVLQKLEEKSCRVLGVCHLVKILMPSDMTFSEIFSPNKIHTAVPYIFSQTRYSFFFRDNYCILSTLFTSYAQRHGG